MIIVLILIDNMMIDFVFNILLIDFDFMIMFKLLKI